MRDFEIRDALMVLGISCVTAGVWHNFGSGWAGIAAGVLLVGLALIAG